MLKGFLLVLLNNALLLTMTLEGYLYIQSHQPANCIIALIVAMFWSLTVSLLTGYVSIYDDKKKTTV